MSTSTSAPRELSFAEAIERVPLAAPFKRFIIPANLNRIYTANAFSACPSSFVKGMLSRVGVTTLVTDIDLSHIPKTGPVVVVANHPHGILDGLLLFDMLLPVRPDVKILANSLLASFPEMEDRLILVDPFGAVSSKEANRRGVRETLLHLQHGGLLVIFPAGEVSHVEIRKRKIIDARWNENISRFIRLSEAAVVPVYIKGSNSLTFQIAGMIHSQLRTARLLHELMNKQRKTVEVRIANPISHATMRTLANPTESTLYLRRRTYLLENRNTRKPVSFSASKSAVIASAPVEEIARQVSLLPRLASAGDLEVYQTLASEAPAVMQEIGRLREITFRLVGEGTGRTLDLDRFDQHYRHIFLWDRVTRRIAGAYRLGVTAEILPRFGSDGLYSSSLFHFDSRFFERLGPAIELGRSFIRVEYQRQYGPLLLLWRGIGAYVSRNPRNPVLFGPVSISNSYHPVSRRLIVQYLQGQESVRDLARLVRPRRKFRAFRRGADNEMVSRMLRDSDELSDVTADIEPDGKGIPVLLKQYLKLGGKLLGFSVDPLFAQSLDGLIFVDLRNTAPASLVRYLGRDALDKFLSYHRRAAIDRA